MVGKKTMVRQSIAFSAGGGLLDDVSRGPPKALLSFCSILTLPFATISPHAIAKDTQ